MNYVENMFCYVPITTEVGVTIKMLEELLIKVAESTERKYVILNLGIC